jgi:hypothetical protein
MYPRARQSRRRASGGSLAEFGPVMWVFCLFIMIPLLDATSFLWGVATVMLAANAGARDAACAQTFTDAKAAVADANKRADAFRCFAKVTPSAGSGDGMTLICLVTDVSGNSGAPTVFAPGSVVDTTTKSYHYCCNAAFDVMPLFNFGGATLFDNVPGLGKPVPVTFSATASVEHPEGLSN